MVDGFFESKSKLGIGTGKGKMQVKVFGVQDYIYEKYGDTISMSKPTCHVYNIIMGELYIDAEDQIKVTNYRTGETATINYIQRGWSSNPKLEGQIFDADNTLKWKIEGSWWDKLSMKNVETGQEVSLFSELPKKSPSFLNFPCTQTT